MCLACLRADRFTRVCIHKYVQQGGGFREPSVYVPRKAWIPVGRLHFCRKLGISAGLW